MHLNSRYRSSTHSTHNFLRPHLSSMHVDFPFTINSGEIITQAFLSVGQERFASISALPSSGKAANAANQGDVTILLSLLHQSYQPVNKTGQEDRYEADLDLQLLAVYTDSQGNALAKSPLSYHDRSRVWTPQLSSESASCATGMFDGEIETGANQLAHDMVDAMPQLLGQPAAPETASQPAPAPQQAPLAVVPQPGSQAPVLSFRTMLKDGNDNLILEGGEKLILQIETTNKSTIAIPTAFINLSGSQTIIDAFTRVTSLPINLGSLQPGETKTTEIRGIMPTQIQV